MVGSPYALLVFKREFGESLPNIVSHIRREFLLNETIDIVSVLGVCWAMCKSYDDYGTPGFGQWFEDFGFEDGIPQDAEEAIVAFNECLGAIEQELVVSNRPAPRNGSENEQPWEDLRSGEGEDISEWVEWSNILAVLKLGFSYDDIKHMPMTDFIAYTDIIANEYEHNGGGSRKDVVLEADQAAIDRLFPSRR